MVQHLPWQHFLVFSHTHWAECKAFSTCSQPVMHFCFHINTLSFFCVRINTFMDQYLSDSIMIFSVNCQRKCFSLSIDFVFFYVLSFQPIFTASFWELTPLHRLIHFVAADLFSPTLPGQNAKLSSCSLPLVLPSFQHIFGVRLLWLTPTLWISTLSGGRFILLLTRQNQRLKVHVII